MSQQFGFLPPKYKFSLNPYSVFRFSKCPDCQNKTGQNKLPLLIHIDPNHLIALNYTNRYCRRCEMLIGHKHEIEHYLTEMFLKINPEVIGNYYLIFGTVEKKGWRENMKHPKQLNEMRQYIHEFKSYQNIRMTIGGWFLEGKSPPEMKLPPSTEWVKNETYMSLMKKTI